jgi:flagellar biosynthesis/type III secretory pathway M-ring protein FliF/YscJ
MSVVVAVLSIVVPVITALFIALIVGVALRVVITRRTRKSKESVKAAA